MRSRKVVRFLLGFVVFALVVCVSAGIVDNDVLLALVMAATGFSIIGLINK